MYIMQQMKQQLCILGSKFNAESLQDWHHYKINLKNHSKSAQ